MGHKKILIATGGGGHFSPALAVIEAMPKDYEVLVAGRKYALEGDKALSLEYQTTQNLKIPFVSLTSGRLQRKFTVRTIPSLLKFPIGLIGAVIVIRDFRPNIILSFGGYVSLPIILAGWLFHIPIMIHEQTLSAGLANRIAGFFAKKVCISFESSAKYFPKNKVILTGNPIRKSKIKNQKSKIQIKIDKSSPVIFVTGGSSGSHFINRLIEQVLTSLVQKYNIIHQTGDSHEFKDYERLSQLKSSLPQKLAQRYTIAKFVEPDEFGSILSKADLVISRAGMNTVSEIIAFGKPAILIPLPYSQGNEQLHNAQFVKNLSLGIFLNQKDLTTEEFEKSIKNMTENTDSFKEAGKKAKKLIVEGADKKIIEVLKEYV